MDADTEALLHEMAALLDQSDADARSVAPYGDSTGETLWRAHLERLVARIEARARCVHAAPVSCGSSQATQRPRPTVVSLPGELQCLIFQHLEWPTLLRCRRVCTLWAVACLKWVTVLPDNLRLATFDPRAGLESMHTYAGAEASDAVRFRVWDKLENIVELKICLHIESMVFYLQQFRHFSKRLRRLEVSFQYYDDPRSAPVSGVNPRAMVALAEFCAHVKHHTLGGCTAVAFHNLYADTPDKVSWPQQSANPAPSHVHAHYACDDADDADADDGPRAVYLTPLHAVLRQFGRDITQLILSDVDGTFSRPMLNVGTLACFPVLVDLRLTRCRNMYADMEGFDVCRLPVSLLRRLRTLSMVACTSMRSVFGCLLARLVAHAVQLESLTLVFEVDPMFLDDFVGTESIARICQSSPDTFRRLRTFDYQSSACVPVFLNHVLAHARDTLEQFKIVNRDYRQPITLVYPDTMASLRFVSLVEARSHFAESSTIDADDSLVYVNQRGIDTLFDMPRPCVARVELPLARIVLFPQNNGTAHTTPTYRPFDELLLPMLGLFTSNVLYIEHLVAMIMTMDMASNASTRLCVADLERLATRLQWHPATPLKSLTVILFVRYSHTHTKSQYLSWTFTRPADVKLT